MVFTTIAIRPETKKVLAEFRTNNTLGFNSYDELIMSFLQTSRNAERLEKRSQRASNIFNLLLGEFPEFWGVIQNIVINNTSKETLEWLLGIREVGRDRSESKKIAKKEIIDKLRRDTSTWAENTRQRENAWPRSVPKKKELVRLKLVRKLVLSL